MDSFIFGEWTVRWLDGGITNMDGGAMFGVVPRPLWSKKYPHNDLNQIELPTEPILLTNDSHHILIDSGVGHGKLSDKQKRNYGVTRESNIERSLNELNLKSTDVDIILMTHMHFDHASGLTEINGDKLVSSFPNAKIYTSKVEWDELREPNIRSRNTYWEDNWKPIEDQVITFNEEIEIIPGVKMIHTGGHSDGHSIVVVEQNGETMIHMADLMPTHAHQNPLWVLAYDDYPMTSITAKQKWVKKGIEENWWFTFYHDSFYRALKWDATGKEMIDSVKRTPFTR
ncbi:MBL fold metallo-hydrolase [Jeotgalibacillus sp. S-D1]|uniref:YtnP family quorum-quenching lactonase n=1 Tax=Jeotgalibacillus sp. S-D1 TaxID=2552189 RepID=UPI00105A755C|nr:MBL fold metallo-hydrolase [Jeotgalibacillus sp. S-D1]TDL34251.1 MBL fold metallo-hydrolase [Jeotgalibacillus sp. S-D1]